MGWEDLTIEQAQFIYDLNKTIVDDVSNFEAQVKAVSYLRNIPEDVIDSWTPEMFNSALNTIAFIQQPLPEIKPLQKFRSNGTTYKVFYDIRHVRKQSVSAYNEFLNLEKGEDQVVKNLHKIMALTVKPVGLLAHRKDRDKVVMDMLKAPFLTCLSVANFYSRVYIETLKQVKPYLSSELEKKGIDKEQAEEAVNIIVEVIGDNSIK